MSGKELFDNVVLVAMAAVIVYVLVIVVRAVRAEQRDPATDQEPEPVSAIKPGPVVERRDGLCFALLAAALLAGLLTSGLAVAIVDGVSAGRAIGLGVEALLIVLFLAPVGPILVGSSVHELMPEQDSVCGAAAQRAAFPICVGAASLPAIDLVTTFGGSDRLVNALGGLLAVSIVLSLALGLFGQPRFLVPASLRRRPIVLWRGWRAPWGPGPG